MKRIIWRSTQSLILVLFISACGGGGTGAGGATYSGVTTQAPLTADNANAIFSMMWTGGASPSISLSPAASKTAATGYPQGLGILPMTERMAKRLSGGLAGFSGGLKKMRSATPVSETIPGAVSGTLTMSGSIDDTTLTGSVTMTYTNFNDGDGYTIDGVVTMSVDGVDRGSGNITDATMSFTSWTMKSTGIDITLGGSIRIQESVQARSETLTINMVGRDNIGNDSFQLENYVQTSVYDNLYNPTSESETYSGRVYAGRYGYVDVSTVSPCIYSDPSGDPSDGGPIILAGAGNTSASITPLSEGYVKIEVDADGDGVYEEKNAYAWGNLAGAPATESCFANVGADQTVLTGTLATLDGSRSEDLDGATLTYFWTMTGKPAGSESALPDPSSKTTTFATDIAGDYTISLIVSNGTTSSVSDTVVVTATSRQWVQPAARTNDASNIADTTVKLNGTYTGNPVSTAPAAAWFEYGTTYSYGNTAALNLSLPISSQWVSVNVSGLQPRTTYHFRLVARNENGTFHGQDKTFTTLATPQILASGLNSPHALAVDSTNVYWIDSGSGDGAGSINKVGINGGTVTTLASGLYDPSFLAVDSTSIYWTDNSQGTVNKIGINGGAITVLASGSIFPGLISVDSTNVYWMGGWGLNKVSINGGAVTTLATGISFPSGLVSDSANVYWVEDHGVKKVGLNGGAVTTLAPISLSGLSNSRNIAIDATSVYWVEYSALKKVNKDGGAATILASDLMVPSGLVVDSTGIYWSSDGDMKRKSFNDGAVTPIATGLMLMTPEITTDATSVYWIYSGIKKIQK